MSGREEGWEGGGVGGGGGGGWPSQRRVLPALTVALHSQQVTDMCTTHRMGQDGHCQQFDTTPTLISAPQWPHRPCNASIQPYRVGKKPSVKADLAMYMSVSLILGYKLDFSSCVIRAGFRKSSHTYCAYERAMIYVPYLFHTQHYYHSSSHYSDRS